MLFDELDDDHDGQVSFEEFLHGLFMARDKGQESDSHSDGFFNGLEVRHGTSFPVTIQCVFLYSRSPGSFHNNMIMVRT